MENNISGWDFFVFVVFAFFNLPNFSRFTTWACAGPAGPAILMCPQLGVLGLWSGGAQLPAPSTGQPCRPPGRLWPSAIIWASGLSAGKCPSNRFFVIWGTGKFKLTKEPRNCIPLRPPFFLLNHLKKWGIHCYPMPHRDDTENWKQAPSCPSALAGFFEQKYSPCHTNDGESGRLWGERNSFKISK